MSKEHTKPTSERAEIAKTQYECFRKERHDALKETWTLERYAVIGIATLWAWLFSRDEWRAWMSVASYIPAFVAIFAAVRVWALYRVMRLYSSYMIDVERRFNLPSERDSEEAADAYVLSSVTIFWVSLILLCLGIGFLFGPSWLVVRSAGT